jgi:hypothetical protein
VSDKNKSEFWWASIAGANCEPVEVTMIDGKRVAYTCGCGDPFYIDEPECLCVLIPVYEYRGNGVDSYGPMVRVLTPKQEKRQEAKERRINRELARHRWRGQR